MNNKVQQRFDRSIQQALEITRQVEVRQAAENLAKVKATQAEKAARLLPEIAKALATGELRGRKISRGERKTLTELQLQYMEVVNGNR